MFKKQNNKVKSRFINLGIQFGELFNFWWIDVNGIHVALMNWTIESDGNKCTNGILKKKLKSRN